MAEEVVLMKGNEAIAHAAIRIGVDGYFGYPITPQSEILETLAEDFPVLKLPDFLLSVLNLGGQFFKGFCSRFRHGWSLLSACRHRKRTVDFLGCPCGWLFNFSLLFSNI